MGVKRHPMKKTLLLLLITLVGLTAPLAAQTYNTVANGQLVWITGGEVYVVYSVGGSYNNIAVNSANANDDIKPITAIGRRDVEVLDFYKVNALYVWNGSSYDINYTPGVFDVAGSLDSSWWTSFDASHPGYPANYITRNTSYLSLIHI